MYVLYTVHVIKNSESMYYMHKKSCKYQNLKKSVIFDRGHSSFSTSKAP
jgi:hypothetical protein